ncbi:MAG: hypothetical protein Q9180_000169 [Flavoplaca navasiana]
MSDRMRLDIPSPSSQAYSSEAQSDLRRKNTELKWQLKIKDAQLNALKAALRDLQPQATELADVKLELKLTSMMLEEYVGLVEGSTTQGQLAFEADQITASSPLVSKEYFDSPGHSNIRQQKGLSMLAPGGSHSATVSNPFRRRDYPTTNSQPNDREYPSMLGLSDSVARRASFSQLPTRTTSEADSTSSDDRRVPPGNVFGSSPAHQVTTLPPSTRFTLSNEAKEDLAQDVLQSNDGQQTDSVAKSKPGPRPVVRLPPTNVYDNETVNLGRSRPSVDSDHTQALQSNPFASEILSGIASSAGARSRLPSITLVASLYRDRMARDESLQSTPQVQQSEPDASSLSGRGALLPIREGRVDNELGVTTKGSDTPNPGSRMQGAQDPSSSQPSWPNLPTGTKPGDFGTGPAPLKFPIPLRVPEPPKAPETTKRRPGQPASFSEIAQRAPPATGAHDKKGKGRATDEEEPRPMITTPFIRKPGPASVHQTQKKADVATGTTAIKQLKGPTKQAIQESASTTTRHPRRKRVPVDNNKSVQPQKAKEVNAPGPVSTLPGSSKADTVHDQQDGQKPDSKVEPRIASSSTGVKQDTSLPDKVSDKSIPVSSPPVKSQDAVNRPQAEEKPVNKVEPQIKSASPVANKDTGSAKPTAVPEVKPSSSWREQDAKRKELLAKLRAQAAEKGSSKQQSQFTPVMTLPNMTQTVVDDGQAEDAKSSEDTTLDTLQGRPGTGSMDAKEGTSVEVTKDTDVHRSFQQSFLPPESSATREDLFGSSGNRHVSLDDFELLLPGPKVWADEDFTEQDEQLAEEAAFRAELRAQRLTKQTTIGEASRSGPNFVPRYAGQPVTISHWEGLGKVRMPKAATPSSNNADPWHRVDGRGRDWGPDQITW